MGCPLLLVRWLHWGTSMSSTLAKNCHKSQTHVVLHHHFRPYLYWKIFLLWTNYASLTWLLNFKKVACRIAEDRTGLQLRDPPLGWLSSCQCKNVMVLPAHDGGSLDTINPQQFWVDQEPRPHSIPHLKLDSIQPMTSVECYMSTGPRPSTLRFRPATSRETKIRPELHTPYNGV